MTLGRGRTRHHKEELHSLSRGLILCYSEAWRYTGPFTRFNRFRGAFPGFGIALVAFSGYLVYEQMFMTSSHHHGEGEHH